MSIQISNTDYIESNNIAYPITVASWVYLPTTYTGVSPAYIMSYGDNTNVIALLVADTFFRLDCIIAGGEDTNTINLNISNMTGNKWYYIGFTLTSTTFKFFVGEMGSNTSFATAATNNVYPTTNMKVRFGYYSYINRSFNGLIAATKIYNSVLSDSDIALQKDLLIYKVNPLYDIPMTDYSNLSNQLIDYSGNANNLITVSSPTINNSGPPISYGVLSNQQYKEPYIAPYYPYVNSMLLSTR